MWNGLLLSLLLSVSMGFSFKGATCGLSGRVEDARGNAVRATVATTVGLTALGLVFSYQGLWLGGAAVVFGIGFSHLAARLVPQTVSLVISTVALYSYLELAGPWVSTV
jgi:hypothetical protein